MSLGLARFNTFTATFSSRAQSYAHPRASVQCWNRQACTPGACATQDELLAHLALPIAQLISAESPELVRRCAGPECTLWFVDRTKAHRRMFCCAAACGNRAKVAAFRERQRG